MAKTRSRRRRWPWIVAGALVIVLIPVAIPGIPILVHQNQGLSHQERSSQAWPVEATATGDDARTRRLSAAGEAGATVDTSALSVGQHLVVTGSGYDASRGICRTCTYP
jgi:hypothetical protein